MSTQKFLDSQILLDAGTKMLQLVSSKFQEIEELQYPVVPKVQPGFLRQQFSEQPPSEPESIDSILNETSQKIFPGLTLWSHPNFYAYYPSNITHSAIIAEIFASAFGTPGFQWLASPAQTELENIVVDWIAYALNLPSKFLMKNQGGGTISGTISDAVFISIHIAKRRKMKELNIDTNSPEMLKFVAYYPETIHASAIKGLYLKDIHYQRCLPSYYDEEQQNYLFDYQKAKEIIEQDIANGLIPFWITCTFGTTGTCAIDNVEQISKICQQYKIWLNLDAAYAGVTWMIPEYRNKVNLDLVDSLEVNFAKMMMSGITGSLFYVANKNELSECMGSKIEFTMYKNKFTENYDVWDYKDWQVALGKRFNSIKLFWIIKSLGTQGMIEQMEQKIKLAQYFASFISQSDKFKFFTKQQVGLITFYLVKDNLEQQNEANKKLQQLINEDTKFGFITGSLLKETYYLRVVICNHTTTENHLLQFWNHLNKLAQQL